MSKGKTSRIVSWAVIVLVLIAVCGFLAYFTDGFHSDLKNFYVLSGGRPLKSTKDYTLAQGENKFEVKYTIGAPKKDVARYTVKIVPNTDFGFTVDGTVYSFAAEKDLSKGFNITYDKDSFTIEGDFSAQSVLEKIYAGSEIDTDANTSKAFTLQVYSYDESVCVEVGISQEVAVTGVTLQETLVLKEESDG